MITHDYLHLTVQCVGCKSRWPKTDCFPSSLFCTQCRVRTLVAYFVVFFHSFFVLQITVSICHTSLNDMGLFSLPWCDPSFRHSSQECSKSRKAWGEQHNHVCSSLGTFHPSICRQVSSGWSNNYQNPSLNTDNTYKHFQFKKWYYKVLWTFLYTWDERFFFRKTKHPVQPVLTLTDRSLAKTKPGML